jgi:hypothetical protein
MSENVNELPTLGWDAITKTFETFYPEQTDPLHFGTVLSWALGGQDPLTGISVYDGGDFYHFVTYGFTELFDKESKDLEYSGYGFEFTLKLKKSDSVDDSELKNIAGILQALARVVFENNSLFRPYEYIYTGQTQGIDSKQQSKITGFVTIPDTAGTIQTPNGKVTFILLVGMTDKELRAIREEQEKQNVEEKIKQLTQKIPECYTDYNRNDCL